MLQPQYNIVDIAIGSVTERAFSTWELSKDNSSSMERKVSRIISAKGQTAQIANDTAGLRNLTSDPIESTYGALTCTTGFLHCLTAEQEEKMLILWLMLFELFKRDFDQDQDMSQTVAREIYEKTLNAFQFDLLKNSIFASTMSTNPLLDELLCQSAFEDPDRILLRFLRARNWSLSCAFLQLVNALRWRRRVNVREIMRLGEYDPAIARQVQSGRLFSWGKDKQGRPVTYILQRNYDRDEQTLEEFERATVYSIESAHLFTDSPDQLACTVFDLGGISFSRNVDFSSAKVMINSGQEYYPEMVGITLVKDAPFLFKTIWRVISPWLDPVVSSKIEFVSGNELFNYINEDSIPKIVGGKNEVSLNFIPVSVEEGPVILSREEEYRFNQNQSAASSDFVICTLKYILQRLCDPSNPLLNEVHARRKTSKKALSNIYKEYADKVHAKTVYHRLGIF